MGMKNFPTSALLLAIVVLATAPAGAQSYGQWWWEGYAGIGQRSTENLVDSESTSEFDLREIKLGLALNGFLGDPSLGRFRVGVDLLTSDQEGGRVVDTDDLGIEASVDLVPRGKYPTRFFFRRRSYDYTVADATNPLLIGSLPDTNEQWGAQFRVRQGPLTGLELGLDNLDYDFLAREPNGQSQDRSWLSWARTGPALQQSVRLEKRRQDFGFTDLLIDDWTFNLEERLSFEDRWRWQMSGIGIVRDVTTASSPLSTDDFRLRNRFTFFVRDDDQLDLRSDWSVLRNDGSSIDSQGMSLFYRWRLRTSWEVAPFAQYLRQEADELMLISPRLGVAVTWSQEANGWNALATGRISYGEIERRQDGATVNEEDEAYGFTGSLGRGTVEGLRKELEIEFARNELALTRGPLVQLPDLGLSTGQLGTDDLYRSRLTLRRRWGPRMLDAWSQWDRRESNGQSQLNAFESETLTASLQASGRLLNLQANVGATEVLRESRPPERIDFRGLALGARPARSLSLRASYREDVRELVLTPDLDGEWLQLELTYRIGEIVLEGQAFRTEQRIAGKGERTNRGFRWTVSRRLRGLLPVVTGAQRRGEIR